MKIAEPCPLIDPSQVVVTQGEILTADPVLTPIGTFSISAVCSPALIPFDTIFFLAACVHLNFVISS